MAVNRKIKINFVNNLFWLAPSFSSYFKGRNFGYTPFKTLEDLINKTEIKNSNLYFSFNSLKEINYDFYNKIQKIKDLNFRLNKENLYKIEKNGFIDDDSIDDRIVVRWDLKSLKWIQKGYLPFFEKDYIIENFKDSNLEKKTFIRWSKNEFIKI